MAGSKAPRVLLAGDVRGNILQLLKRVNGVNKSNGPFDFLFCLGPFFAQGSDASLAASELADFLDGKQKLVVTTYFLADESEECRKAVAGARGRGGAVERLVGSKSAIDVEICENLHCLIGAGIHNLKGLRLAYVAGSYDALSFFEPISDDDLAAGAESASTFVQRKLELEQLIVAAAGGDSSVVDILLTHDWPRGVLTESSMEGLPSDITDKKATLGTPVAADAVLRLKPRYHVAGMEGAFFAREPYSSEGVTHVTRFIGLGAVGNTKKQKYIHALNPVPAATMSPADLAIQPANTTSSPLEPRRGGRGKPSQGGGDFRTPPRATGANTLPLGSGTATPATAPIGGKALPGFVSGGMGGDTGTPGQPPAPPPFGISPQEAAVPDGQYWRYDTTPQAKRPRRDNAEGGDRVCFDFQKGSCARGASCRFKHVEEGGPPAVDGDALPKGVCFDFIKKGSCERGSECRYRHSMEEGGGGGGGGGARGEPLPKGVCFDFFKKGRCERGGECRFRHALEGESGEAGGRAEMRPRDPCWFCLSSPAVEVHLVASVAEHCYAAVTKGPLVPGHVLVLPIEHFPSSLSLPPEAFAELMRYKSALARCYEGKGQSLVVFERYIELRAGTHAHLQVIPVPQRVAAASRSAFESFGERSGCAFRVIPPGPEGGWGGPEMRSYVGGGTNYFVAELPDGTLLVLRLGAGSRLPLQFGREVVAELLNMPDRSDWKACKLSKEEELQMTETFKADFSTFDIM